MHSTPHTTKMNLSFVAHVLKKGVGFLSQISNIWKNFKVKVSVFLGKMSIIPKMPSDSLHLKNHAKNFHHKKLLYVFIYFLKTDFYLDMVKTTAAMAKNRMRNTKWYFKIRKVFLYAVKISLSLFFSSKHIN